MNTISKNQNRLRFKMMCESIGIRTNFKIHNIVTTYASDAGDNPITTLAFGLVFDNPDYIR